MTDQTPSRFTFFASPKEVWGSLVRRYKVHSRLARNLRLEKRFANLLLGPTWASRDWCKTVAMTVVDSLVVKVSFANRSDSQTTRCPGTDCGWDSDWDHRVLAACDRCCNKSRAAVFQRRMPAANREANRALRGPEVFWCAAISSMDHISKSRGRLRSAIN